MKLIKPRLSRRKSNGMFVAVSLALTVSSALAAVFSLPGQQSATAAKSIVGAWEMYLTEEGKDPKGSSLEFPISLLLNLEGDKLAGKAIFPEIRDTGDGPKKVGESALELRELKYAEKVLSFKIEGDDKGDFADLKLQLVGEQFLGRWIILRNGENGIVKMMRKQAANDSLIEKIVGEWTVTLAAENSPAAGEIRLTLLVKANGKKLTAKTLLDLNGEKKEWQLLDPKFDGDTFLFKVNNGEEILEGKLKLVEDRFEGPWKAVESGVGGTMKLFRKK